MGITRIDEWPGFDDGSSGSSRDLSLPPHDEEAERAVIASVLLRSDSLAEVSSFLKPEQFYLQKHRHIFRAMLALEADGHPVDYESTADRLRQIGHYEESGGLLYLSELNLAFPSAAHIEHYGRIVERTWVMREVISRAQTMAEIAYRDNLSAEAVVDKWQTIGDGIAASLPQKDFRLLEDILNDYLKQTAAVAEGEQQARGIPTGFIDIDKMLGGLSRTDLIVIGGRTSQGKTSFAINIALNAATRYGATIAIFSLEMAAEQLVNRMLSMESGVESGRINSAHLNEAESLKLDTAMNKLAAAKIWIDDTSTLSLNELLNKARRLASSRVLDMIVVDYVQLIDGGSEESDSASRVLEIARITRKLKALARDLAVPVIILSQVSRQAEQRSPPKPQLGDLRESGSLEQDADVVMFVYREERYTPDTERKGIADILIRKNRNGPTGDVPLLFLERTTKFLDTELFRG